MRRLLTTFPWFAAGIALVLILLEVLFRILPVSTATRSGYYADPVILTYPAHHCFVAATGWDLKNNQRICANNYGFVADHDFESDPNAVALIGDSFIEANMLPAQDRPAAQLEKQLRGRQVYAFGGPGSNLLDYAERARFAATHFGIKTFVFVIERGDIKQAMCGSGNVHGPCFDAKMNLQTETQPPPSAAKRLLRESALAQYVFSQLKFDPALAVKNLLTKWQTAPSPPGQTPRKQGNSGAPLSVARTVLNQFFSRLSTIDGGRFMFVIDADRAHLLDGPIAETEDLQLLRTEAEARKAIVVDTTKAFRAFEAGSGRSLEVGPYDHHWNRDAVRVASNLIAEKLSR